MSETCIGNLAIIKVHLFILLCSRYHQAKKLKQQLHNLGVSLSDYEGAPQLDFNDLKGEGTTIIKLHV